jgi:DNA (cytosine-5)-methyltransferase 1
LIADTLTSGSHPASNMPGRRREDDTNLAVYPLARRGREGGSTLEVGEEGTYNALRAGNGGSSRLNQVMVGTGVRRLTPVECERLQGFPDGWTAHGPDSRRYAALGDAVTVNVAEWIGRRLIEAA